MGQTTFIQLPPDGVGKRVRQKVITDLKMASVVTQPDVGSTLYGATSGASGKLTGKYTAEDTTWYLRDVSGVFIAGELLKDLSSVITYGTISSLVSNLHVATAHISDPLTPDYVQRVNQRGAALVSFPEGTPQFDAFGHMQVSQMQAVGEYYHVQQDQPGKYYTQEVSGGNVSYSVSTSSIVYSLPTTAGAIARRTTNQYHPYKPGVSQLIYMTVALGDSGKNNLTREWGYFDDLNGFGFRLENSTLKVFLRSDTSGTVQETVASQSNWNQATLLDATTSDFELDITQGNIYWMDMAWLGMGMVTLGVITPDGRRIACHQFQNANQNPYPYMRTGCLPLTWRMENTNTTSSSSEMRVTCAVVFTESADLLYTGIANHVYPPNPVIITGNVASNGGTGLYTPFLSFRAKLNVNGKINRQIGIHEAFDWCSNGASSIHVGICVFGSNAAANLQGATWTSGNNLVPNSLLDMDQTAYSMNQTGYTMIESFIAPANSSGRVTLGDRMEKSFAHPANPNITSQDDLGIFVFAAKALTPNVNPGLFYTKYWKEIR
jgi:hypothetical protein